MKIHQGIEILAGYNKLITINNQIRDYTTQHGNPLA